ncbi:MAG: hypothetical protein AAGF23_07750 [Acidobacteriota bacterium]
MSRGPHVVGGRDDQRRRVRAALAGPAVDRPGCTVILPVLDGAGHLDRPTTLEALAGALDAGASGLLIISSSRAQPPRFGHPGMVRERPASVLLGRHPSSDPWNQLEIDAAAAADARGAAWRVLRPTPVRIAGGEDPWNRLIDADRPAVPLGFSPPVQFLHPDDFHRALRWASERFDDLPEVVHVAPQDAAPLREALGLAGVRFRRRPFSWLRLRARLPRRPGGRVSGSGGDPGAPKPPISLDGLRGNGGRARVPGGARHGVGPRRSGAGGAAGSLRPRPRGDRRGPAHRFPIPA